MGENQSKNFFSISHCKTSVQMTALIPPYNVTQLLIIENLVFLILMKNSYD